MKSIVFIQAGLEDVNMELNDKLKGLSPAELKWQPKPDANSIGLIWFHMVRAEDSLMNSWIQEKAQVWETGKWYLKMKRDVKDEGCRYSAEQVQAFVIPNQKVLHEYSSAVRKNTLEYLENLTSEKLQAKVNLPPPPPAIGPDGKPLPPHKPPFEPIVWSLLIFNVFHLSLHAGEISYIRGLIRGMDK
jgi:hypothetical protein